MTATRTTQPVMYEDKIYGYDAFVTPCVNKPIHPFTNKPIDLSKLKKMRLHFLPRMERKRYDRLLFQAQGGFF